MHISSEPVKKHLHPDIAEQMLHVNTTREAKSIATVIKTLYPSSHWNLVKYDVMRQVLRAKSESSEVFWQNILDTGDKYLVESSVTDNHWGSGLSYNLTITTPHELFPGKKKLGKTVGRITNGTAVLISSRMENPTIVPYHLHNYVDIPDRTHLSVIELPPPEPTTPVLVMVPSTSGQYFLLLRAR